MKIGLVSADFHPNVGGVAAHVVELGKAHVAAGHEVHVVTRPLGSETSSRSEFHGMVVHRPAIARLQPIYTYATHFWLKSFLSRTPLDILHVHGMRPLQATRHLGVPVVFTNHTSGFLKRVAGGPVEQERARRRLTHIRRVFAPSEELVEATLTVGYDGPVEYIPNGVDTGRFHPGLSPLRNAWDLDGNDIAVLLARRLVEKNGVTVFAEAVCQSKAHRVKFVFAGDGPERGRVEEILKAGNRLADCRFLGNVPNPDMPEIYRAADISVLPSFMEATSITGLESMATGLPLVGTHVGGIPDLIDEGRSGFLVPPRDPASLADRIDRLAADAPLRAEMGRHGRLRAESKFSWGRIAARTVQGYDEVIGSLEASRDAA